LIFAIAEYVTVAFAPMILVVAADRETAGKNAIVSPLTGVPVALANWIAPDASTSSTVIVMSLVGEAPPKEVPGIMNW
jgi:hypothetical protein